MLELKTITETAIMREDADPNKLHYNELRNVANAWTVEEATAVIEELAKKHPTIIFMTLSARMDEMNIALSDIKCSLGVLRDANS